MNDLNEYDSAFARYSKALDGKPAPLHSWDFFSKHFEDLKNSFSDAIQLEDLSKENNWLGNWNFQEALLAEKVIVVTNPKLEIVFASQNISKMTGYSLEEIIGKNPKLFQGESTSQKDLEEIKEAIKNQKPFEKTVLNYKKDGTTYDCQIQAFPIFNTKKELVNFVAFEKAA